MDCLDRSHQYMKNDTYVMIGWYDQPSILPGRTEDCPDWSIRPCKIDPYILIDWYDHPYQYWMDGFKSTNHELYVLVPSVYEKDLYVLISWYNHQSILPGRTKDSPDLSIMPCKIDPYVLIGWYDQPYPYWMEAFKSTDNGKSRLDPSVHEKWPICTDRLIRLAIRTAWNDERLSRQVH